MNDNKKKRPKEIVREIECTLRGKVQGVSFRLFAKKKATELGLTGSASNEEDGSLVVIAQGEEEALKQFIEHLKKGVYFSRVDDMEVKWFDTLQDSLSDFSVL